jgi:hypothetical protein
MHHQHMRASLNFDSDNSNASLFAATLVALKMASHFQTSGLSNATTLMLQGMDARKNWGGPQSNRRPECLVSLCESRA